MRTRIFKISVLAVMLVVLAAVFYPSSVQAQEKKGFVYFKMGQNSEIESSALQSPVNFGFGFGFRLPFSSQRHQVFLEPGLAMHWPQKEFMGLDMYGYPLQLQTSTLFFDFNGSYSFSDIESRYLPYVTGGIGFLRNSLSLPSYGISLDSDAHFTKNAGAGLKYFLGEEQSWFVGAEVKNYWSGGGSFRTIMGTIGIKF